MNETQNEEQLRFPDDIMEEGGNLAGRIEAILFVAGEAVRVEDLSKALDVPIREVEDALIHLRDEYDFNQRGFSLKRYGHQVQLATRALYSQDVVRLLQPVQKQSLSQAAMDARGRGVPSAGHARRGGADSRRGVRLLAAIADE